MTEIGASSTTPKTAKASVSKKVDEDFKNGPIAEVDEDEAEVQNKRLVEESNKNKELEFENRRLAHELAQQIKQIRVKEEETKKYREECE